RIRPAIGAVEAYTPTTSPEVFCERLGLAPGDVVKLDAHENPYGPAPGIRAALAAISDVHIYHDTEAGKLLPMLSEFGGVEAEHSRDGAGADELIELILQLFIEPGDAVINCPPTFGMYSFDAPLAHARVIDVPRGPDFALDVAAIEAAVEAHHPKLLFV